METPLRPSTFGPADPALDAVLEQVPLLRPTGDAWVRCALGQLNALLDDHCQCELKAASNALALVGRHPEKDALVHRLTALAREEMEHWRQVRERLTARGAVPSRPRPSPYLKGLTRGGRGGGEALLDDLLVAALVEARSCERFVALGRALRTQGEREAAAAELADFYTRLARSESGHAHLFLDLARRYFPPTQTEDELRRRLSQEAALLDALPVTPRMHGGDRTVAA